MTNDDRFRLDRVPATEDDWRDAVDGVLKGRPFEKVLVNQTPGGLDIQPLYAPASAEPILPVDPHRVAYGWDIRQRHEATKDFTKSSALDSSTPSISSRMASTSPSRALSASFAAGAADSSSW